MDGNTKWQLPLLVAHSPSSPALSLQMPVSWVCSDRLNRVLLLLLLRAAGGDEEDGRGQADRAGAGLGGEGGLDLAGDRLSGRLVGLLLLDQPGGRADQQRLARLLLGAAADDRRVGALDRDRGEAGRRQNAPDVIGIGKGERDRLVRRGRGGRPQTAQRDVVGNQLVPVLRERRPACEGEAPTGLQRAADCRVLHKAPANEGGIGEGRDPPEIH